MVFQIFEDMRRRNADFYTAHPLANKSDQELADLATQAGLTVEQLKQHIVSPHVEMTCPLCGRASTHLVLCKGCGGGAWGGELVMAYGDEVHSQLRAKFKEAIIPLQDVSLEQLGYAAKHAYSWGGCMVCVECWHNTLPTEAFESCPLKLLGDRTLEPGQLPGNLVYLAFTVAKEERVAAVQEWIKEGWIRWTETWNTVADPVERETVRLWRGSLLVAAWGADQGKEEADVS